MSRANHAGRLIIALAFGFLSSGLFAQEFAILSYDDIHHPVYGRNGMVATQDEIATRVGIEVLRGGGNAVDAAVAVGFALAVTLPRAGNLGGGGFMMIHSASRGKTVSIDYRETAPRAAFKDLYLDQAGNVDETRARFSYQSVGVPGTVAGLSLALSEYGTFSLEQALAPAIRLAANGFVVRKYLADSLKANEERLKRWPETARIFFKRDGSAYEPGDRLIQPELAWSLEQIARQGASAFYRGAIAEKIVADMRSGGGLINASDLDSYQAIIRPPAVGTYRGYDILSMPPPSSGGIHLVQILNILEEFPIAELGANSAQSLHLMAEAMKLAYADRSRHLGDPDFWPVPVEGLGSKAYARGLRARIDPERARPASEIAPGEPTALESNETTHFSVMDAAGNVVSNTYTINFGYGAGIVAAGTGILLNNEMDDFSAKPGVPNAYGLVGGDANAIEPGKRPLSSMTPTIVMKDGEAFLATGSPGGSHIITTTLQIIMNVIDHGMNVAMATAAPRVHHQWLPDELRVERGISPDTLKQLAARGHRVKVKNAMGSTQSIMRIGEDFYGAADPRRPGAFTLGY